MSRYVDVDKYHKFLSNCGDPYPCVGNCIDCYFKCNELDDVEKLAMENTEMKEFLRKVCRANECATCPFVINNIFCEIAGILVPDDGEEETD